MNTSFRVRPATAADVDVLAAHRVAMLIDMGKVQRDSPLAREITAGSREMIAAALLAATWVAWVAEDAGGVVGGGAAMLRASPPSATAPRGGTAAYILNVYTEPRARRRGIATAIVRACLSWCRSNAIVRISLHASDEGRPMYERMGFLPRPNELELPALDLAQPDLAAEGTCAQTR